MTFQQKLDTIVKKNNSLLCVGLDPVVEKLPKYLQKKKYPFLTFNKALIDATADIACSYKPNSAFYEAEGSRGVEELKMTCDYLQKNYPQIPIILDFKRGDISSTNNAYAQFAFDYLQVDAVTLQPYLGKESLMPFLTYRDKGLFILCHTTNPGAAEIQDIPINNEPLYKVIAKKVSTQWNKNTNCMLVLGAAYPEQMEEVREIVGEMTFLVPGVGAQKGDIKHTIQAGLNTKKSGLIINSSRGIMYAENPREEAIQLRDTINGSPRAYARGTNNV